MESDTLNEIKAKTDGFNPKRKEGKIAKAIESQTSKLPSDFFLWTAGAVMAASLTLKLSKVNNLALFIGQWAAPLLLFGVYNKMVKQKGHDSEERQAS
jgi:hypothetical protein